jgi:putative phosphoesterase
MSGAGHGSGLAAGPTTIAIVSDTHMPRGRRELPVRCVELCRSADLILHAGDLSELSVLRLFESFGPPVHAVRGNVDSGELSALLPETLTVEVGDLRIGMIHDAGRKAGRLARLRKRFPDHDAVVFGHSHLPLHESAGPGGCGEAAAGPSHQFQIFNPGSPTERRRSPSRSMGLSSVAGSKIDFELVDLGT